MKYTTKFIFLLLITVCMVACKSEGSENNKINQIKNKHSEDFELFNARFHNDSAFQLSRISFPIGGRYTDGEQSYTWTANNWTMMKTPFSNANTQTGYKHEVSVSDTLIKEKHWIENSDFIIERHFKLQDRKWHLVYYNDLEL